MQIIPNQSEKCFVTCLMKNGRKSIRPNPRQISEWIRTNPKPCFQSELRLIQTEFSFRINSNHSDLGFIRIDSDWKLGFGLVWIHSDCCLGLNWINSDQFFTIFHQASYITFFGLVRNEFLFDTFARGINIICFNFKQFIFTNSKLING